MWTFRVSRRTRDDIPATSRIDSIDLCSLFVILHCVNCVVFRPNLWRICNTVLQLSIFYYHHYHIWCIKISVNLLWYNNVGGGGVDLATDLRDVRVSRRMIGSFSKLPLRPPLRLARPSLSWQMALYRADRRRDEPTNPGCFVLNRGWARPPSRINQC